LSDSPPTQNFIQRIFLSSTESRPRAVWRLLIQTLMLVILTVCIGIPVGVWMYASGVIVSDQVILSLSEITELFGITLSIILARRFLDKRSFASLGLKLDRRVILDLLIGAAIPFLMMGLIFLLEWGMGWLHFENFAWETQSVGIVLARLVPITLILILVGWNEELLCRGYYLQTIADGLNLPLGVIISSAIFGLLHLGNPSATWNSVLGIFLAGLFLAYAYLRTKRLWLSIGLHFGWNFFEGVVFGFPVSGLDFFKLAKINVSGPALWTGGSFGPEAGLIVIPGLLLGVLLVALYTHSKLQSDPNA
jgi:membrane protease YdiL (CAAX protease family)